MRRGIVLALRIASIASAGLLGGCVDLFDIEERTLASCEPGVQRCGANGRETCEADGSGFLIDACEAESPICVAGTCVVCEEGSARCDAGDRETCVEEAWQPAACSLGTTCVKGACVECEPEEARCSMGQRERCSTDGTWRVDACPGETPLCTGDGACGACEPGASRCTETGRERCADDGSGFTLLSCAEDDTCAASLFTGAGNGFTCVVTTCGSVYCWGKNDRHQLDPSAPNELLLPHRLPLDMAVQQGTSGIAHNCVLDVDGGVWCFGDNIGGQSDAVGVTSTPVDEPTLIPLEAAASRIEAGTYHTCAILVDGRVQCFGDPTFYKLGSSDNAFIQPPIALAEDSEVPLTGVVDLGGDRVSTCAVTSAGELRCWGALNLLDYFTGGSAIAGLAAIVILDEGVSEVGMGWFNRAIAHQDLGLMGVGLSGCGQLGIPSDPIGQYIPIPLADPANLVTDPSDVTLGQMHGCALQGEVTTCWGDNRHGQVGVETTCVDDAGATEMFPPICGSFFPPTPVPLVGPAEQVVARFTHTCALVRGPGELQPFCWGEGVHGALGNGMDACSFQPAPVSWPPVSP